MAEKDLKLEGNVDGKWYVDENCIACDSCISIAPDFFSMDEDGEHAYVCKQPETDEDNDLCQEAMESCPSEAIGDDGE